MAAHEEAATAVKQRWRRLRRHAAAAQATSGETAATFKQQWRLLRRHGTTAPATSEETAAAVAASEEAAATVKHQHLSSTGDI